MAESNQVPAKEASPSVSMKVVLKTLALRWPKVNQMSTSSLDKLLIGQDNCVMLMDSRPEEEYNVSHIQGARRVDPDLSDIKEVMSDVLQKAQHGQVTVVCYCALGYRSCLYANAMLGAVKQTEDSSLANRISIHNLEGSLFKWANESRPMVNRMDQPTIFAHPYSAVLGKLLKPELRRSQHMNS